MYFMVVTLDVSRLSDWLKGVLCRVARWAYDARASGAGREVRGRWAGTTAQAAFQGRARLEVWARVRTSNMLSMVVTLDVSRLSNWLKASALCRVARWAYDARAVCGGAGASGIAEKGSWLEAGARART